MMPDLFRKLKHLYGERIDQLWLEYELGDAQRKEEISQLLTILAVKQLGMAVGEERIILDPPPPGLIDRGEYLLGVIEYPGLTGRTCHLGRNDLLRHVFILGPSGTGKSTLILTLLLQLLQDHLPMLVFDFKRNYRCLITADPHVLVATVGRDVAPLRLNALAPPPGVEFTEWAESLTDVIGTAYLLLHGARNVLKEALLHAHQTLGPGATLKDAHAALAAGLGTARAGSRRYGWLESSTRSLQELSTGAFGNSLNAAHPQALAELLGRPLVVELQGLGDDQKRFFCLYMLQAVLLVRKHQSDQREVLRHLLVFDESHNVFPKDQYGELGVPSRLAREVREYGEAIIAATQQTDVADSLIANSGIKIILRTDFPKDVDFASRLLNVDPKWLPKLPLGTGIARLPVRYYQPFLFRFAPQPLKNTPVSDAQVQERWEAYAGTPSSAPAPLVTSVTEKEVQLLEDVAQHPIARVTERYARLGWNMNTGNTTKDALLRHDLARFDGVITPTGRVKILSLTTKGAAHLTSLGIPIVRARGGGPEHEYWKHTITGLLEARGYRVTPEYAVGDGRAVDLHATRNDQELFVEIETGKSNIPANIAKCRDLPGTVVFVFTDQRILEQYRHTLGNATALTTADLDQLAGS